MKIDKWPKSYYSDRDWEEVIEGKIWIWIKNIGSDGWSTKAHIGRSGCCKVFFKEIPKDKKLRFIKALGELKDGCFYVSEIVLNEPLDKWVDPNSILYFLDPKKWRIVHL